MTRSLAAFAVVLALAGPASAAVTVAPGWPRNAPSGTVHQGPDGGVVVISTEADRAVTRAYRKDGDLRWTAGRSFGCGNCDDGPQPEALQPDGTYGPIGVEGDDFWAVDRRGRIVPGCAGVVGADGSCVTGTNVFLSSPPFDSQPAFLVRAADGSTFRVADDRFHWQDEFDVPAMTVADDAGRVYAAFIQPRDAASGATLPGVLMAFDRASRTILWTRTGPTQVLAALPSGVLVNEGGGVAAYAADGTVRWTRAVTSGQRVAPVFTAVDGPRGRVYLGRFAVRRPGVTALDPASGAQVWKTRPSDRARLLSVGRGGRVYLAIDAPDRRGIRGVRFRDGASVWSRGTRLPVRGARELANGTVAVSAGNAFNPQPTDRLTVLDPR